MIPTETFAARLQAKKGGNGWTARCPAHRDDKPSLSIASGADGRTLVHCFVGCTADAILGHLGLTFADIMPEKPGREPEEVAWYDYRDENGAVLFQTVRFWPKDFRQRRPDGHGGWIWDLKGARRVPYRLPELLGSKRTEPVLIVEGEKDANILASLGFVATTSPMGAGKWRDEYSEHFEGRDVAILPDNDAPGREHAKQVAASLERYRAARIVTIAIPSGKDISDFVCSIADREKAVERIDSMLFSAFHEVEAEQAAIREEREIASQEAADRESWNPLDLVNNTSIHEPEGFVYGEVFPRGCVSMIYGESSSGKSYLVMYLGAQIALRRPIHGMETRPGKVLFLSEEMPDAECRFRAGVVWDEEARRLLSPNRFHFRWFSGFDFGGKTLDENQSVHKFVDICRNKTNKPDVVFIDSLSRIMASAEENSNRDMGIVMSNLELAARLAGVAIILIHHTSKPGEFTQKGKHRARGAARIFDSVNDAWFVECQSEQDRKSSVKALKARSIIGKPMPAPFVFTQELDDPPRTFTKSNGEKVPGIRFAIGDYVESGKEAAEKKITGIVKQTVEIMVAERMEAGSTSDEVARIDLIARLRVDQDWSENRADKAIGRAVAKGLIERRGRGSFGLPLS